MWRSVHRKIATASSCLSLPSHFHTLFSWVHTAGKETFNRDPPLSIYQKKIPPYLRELPVTGGVFCSLVPI